MPARVAYCHSEHPPAEIVTPLQDKGIVDITAAGYKKHNKLFVRGKEDMKTVEISENNSGMNVWQLMEWAENENLLIKGKSGQEFVLAIVDDFEAEVESLRYNDEFIAFLDKRAQEPTIPIEEARKRLLEDG